VKLVARWRRIVRSLWCSRALFGWTGTTTWWASWAVALGIVVAAAAVVAIAAGPESKWVVEEVEVGTGILAELYLSLHQGSWEPMQNSDNPGI